MTIHKQLRFFQKIGLKFIEFGQFNSSLCSLKTSSTCNFLNIFRVREMLLIHMNWQRQRILAATPNFSFNIGSCLCRGEWDTHWLHQNYFPHNWNMFREGLRKICPRVLIFIIKVFLCQNDPKTGICGCIINSF